jgi:hypothetical protein
VDGFGLGAESVGSGDGELAQLKEEDKRCIQVVSISTALAIVNAVWYQ